MKIRDELYEIYYLNKRINAMRETAYVLRCSVESAGAIRYDKLNVQTSPVNTQEIIICNYIVIENKIDELYVKLFRKEMDILSRMKALDDEEVRIIKLRYFESLDLKTVQERLGITNINTMYSRLRKAERKILCE